MENKIQKLSQELINQIAAGEVVERPASVVKELVENSLDAGASNITIELENGGINLIKIIDDGCGMTEADAKLSIAQHATSKISSSEDLFKIGTMGFRGEALASISSVSEFSLITKNDKSVTGFEVKVINNDFKYNAISCPTGTTVEVKNLFNNVPARKKYLKTAVTEYNHIVDLFINYVLFHREIAWKLIHNGKVVYQYSKAVDHKNRIYEVLGKDIAENLLEVEFELNNIKVSGFIGKPQISRNNRKLQYLFVNERPVSEYVVSKRVKDAYTTLISNNVYPVYILFVNVSHGEVDVNVHPRKLEVRFSDPQKIYQTIYRAVCDVLDSRELTKNVLVENNIPVRTNSFSSMQKKNVQSDFDQNSQNFRQISNLSVTRGFSQTKNTSFAYEPRKTKIEGDEVLSTEERNYHIIGQVQDSYIIVETGEGIKIYDQHATSERVQYEKIKKQFLQEKISQQQLLLPENIELSPSEANILRNNLDFFIRLGYDLGEFSGNTFIINAVPQIISGKKYQEGIRDIIGEIGEKEVVDNLSNKDIPEVVNRVLNSMSCRSAVMFGDNLSVEQMYALIDDLERGNNKYTCVHGRPCVIEYKFGELEKLFKRRD